MVIIINISWFSKCTTPTTFSHRSINLSNRVLSRVTSLDLRWSFHLATVVMSINQLPWFWYAFWSIIVFCFCLSLPDEVYPTWKIALNISSDNSLIGPIILSFPAPYDKIKIHKKSLWLGCIVYLSPVGAGDIFYLFWIYRYSSSLLIA